MTLSILTDPHGRATIAKASIDIVSDGKTHQLTQENLTPDQLQMLQGFFALERALFIDIATTLPVTFRDVNGDKI